MATFTTFEILRAPQALAGPGITTRVSVSSDGTEGNGGVYGGGSISADGRFVAFVSYATNLVPGPDTNESAEVFVHDRVTGETTRVAGVGGQAALASDSAVISGDGRYVAIPAGHLLVHDRVTGETTVASVSTTGEPATGSDWVPAISYDGRFVAFASDSDELVPQDPGPGLDLFLRDRLLGTTQAVNVSGTGQRFEFLSDVVISGDGRFVAFNSGDPEVVPGDTNGQTDGFVKDRTTGQITRVTVSDSEEEAGGQSQIHSVTADGRWVAFGSSAPNLVPGDTNGTSDAFVRDRQTGETTRVSLAYDGGQVLGDSGASGISDDGRFVAVVSDASNLVPGDTNGIYDVFVHDRHTHQNVRVSVSSDGAQVILHDGGEDAADDGLLGTGTVALSADGGVVAFASSASSLVPGDTNNDWDIFVHDLGAQSTARTLAAGESITSDTEGDGATVFDPVEISVTTPNAGMVTIEESLLTGSPPSGFTLFGRQVVISAPPATAEAPLVMVFRLDASVIPPGETEADVAVLKNDVEVPACAGATGVALPDPCVSSRALLGDGDVALTVLTATASTWTFGLRDSAGYDFSGFLRPVDNLPTVNLLKAGQAVPVKFGLGGDKGLDIFAASYPGSRPIDCGTTAPLDAIEETVTAGSSSLSYDGTLDQYTYVWKTSKAWARTCRALVLRLDGGTDHIAHFRFT